MTIIAEGAKEMKIKDQDVKGGTKMTRIAIATIIVAVLVSSDNAFAYWKAPAGVEVRDPAPNPFNGNSF